MNQILSSAKNRCEVEAVGIFFINYPASQETQIVTAGMGQ
jgi:hypothetical protein